MFQAPPVGPHGLDEGPCEGTLVHPILVSISARLVVLATGVHPQEFVGVMRVQGLPDARSPVFSVGARADAGEAGNPRRSGLRVLLRWPHIPGALVLERGHANL